MTQLEHVVSQRNDDKLRVLRAVFDVVRDNRYVAEVKRRINLVHEVERGRLIHVQSEHQGERTQRLLSA